MFSESTYDSLAKTYGKNPSSGKSSRDDKVKRPSRKSLKNKQVVVARDSDSSSSESECEQKVVHSSKKLPMQYDRSDSDDSSGSSVDLSSKRAHAKEKKVKEIKKSSKKKAVSSSHSEDNDSASGVSALNSKFENIKIDPTNKKAAKSEKEKELIRAVMLVYTSITPKNVVSALKHTNLTQEAAKRKVTQAERRSPDGILNKTYPTSVDMKKVINELGFTQDLTGLNQGELCNLAQLLVRKALGSFQAEEWTDLGKRIRREFDVTFSKER